MSVLAEGPHMATLPSLAQPLGSQDPPDWTLVSSQWEGDPFPWQLRAQIPILGQWPVGNT